MFVTLLFLRVSSPKPDNSKPDKKRPASQLESSSSSNHTVKLHQWQQRYFLERRWFL